MPKTPILYILTGPPGSGKSTIAALSGLPVFSVDEKNIYAFRDYQGGDAVLETCSPTIKAKEYWRGKAAAHGFSPKIISLQVPLWTAVKRMESRSGLTPGAKNTLQMSVQSWYKKYQRHRLEEVVTNV